jgi:hypothetical protein
VVPPCFLPTNQQALNQVQANIADTLRSGNGALSGTGYWTRVVRLGNSLVHSTSALLSPSQLPATLSKPALMSTLPDHHFC